MCARHRLVNAASALAASCLLVACAGEASSVGGGAASSGGGGGDGGGAGGVGGSGPACACEPGIHESRIALLSGDGAIWTYDPVANQIAHQRDIPCAVAHPYSMAVDTAGVAWILDADSKDLVTLPLEGTAPCGDPGFDPGPLQAGFSLFGMAFTARGPGDACADLFAHSYSGSGPFGEGPGAGVLGVLDPAKERLEILAATDYDGAELAGRGDGRLFAFAGVDPVKLVEYDRATGGVVATRALGGFSKTNASAFAVYGKHVYFFTEAPPVGCDACLETSCGAAFQACIADPPCAADLACALEQGDITDACGGLLSAELMSCVAGPCLDACLPSPADRVSQVSRLLLDDPAAALEVVLPAAPLRVVGAGTSICVPTLAN